MEMSGYNRVLMFSLLQEQPREAPHYPAPVSVRRASLPTKKSLVPTPKKNLRFSQQPHVCLEEALSLWARKQFVFSKYLEMFIGMGGWGGKVVGRKGGKCLLCFLNIFI